MPDRIGPINGAPHPAPIRRVETFEPACVDRGLIDQPGRVSPEPTFAERLEAENARLQRAEDEARQPGNSLGEPVDWPAPRPRGCAPARSEPRWERPTRDLKLALPPIPERVERIVQRVEKVYRVTTPITHRTVLDLFA